MRLVLAAILLLPALAFAQPGAQPEVPVAPAPSAISPELLGLARGAHVAGMRGDCVGARTLAARIQRLDRDFYATVISTDLSIVQCKPRPRIYAVEPSPAPTIMATPVAAPRHPVDSGRNVGGQLFLGGALGAGFGIVGGLLGTQILRDGDEDIPVGPILLGSIGLLAGTTAGVVLAGDNEGSDYSLAVTIAGSTLGTLIGFRLVADSHGIGPGGAVLVLVGMPTLGAMLGFNASRRTLYPQASTRITVPAAPRIGDPAATVTVLGGSF